MQYPEGDIATCEEAIIHARNEMNNRLDNVIQAIDSHDLATAESEMQWYWKWCEYMRILTDALYSMEHGDDGVDIYTMIQSSPA